MSTVLVVPILSEQWCNVSDERFESWDVCSRLKSEMTFIKIKSQFVGGSSISTPFY